ncbi:MAG: TraR/DksA C4-type zinc finger protein [Chloroflexota bacterium]|nr:TraR/DksA C4-type zinc finger protein [Chloroflexota bacterium]
MTTTTRDFSELRARLEEEQTRLTGEVEALRAAAVEYSESVADEDRSYGNHIADDATDTYEAERQLALQRNLETVLRDVNDALQRMDAGTYGICVDCGREIPIERLEARPYAIRCIEDQEREDRQR